MDKRTFLKTSLLSTASALLNPFAAVLQATSLVAKGFELPALPYAVDALEPYIDKQTMEIHHSKHHQTYINKLNEALVAKPEWAAFTIEKLLATITEQDTALRNNGGGHYNHSLFWTLLTPQSKQKPEGNLAKAIEKQFGSFETFKELFGKEAAARFGSGWVWLVQNPDQQLAIVSTPNQDNPLMTTIYKNFAGTKPLLCLDVWEHAYYLKYQNKRADYVAAFWNIVNWEIVEKRSAK